MKERERVKDRLENLGFFSGQERPRTPCFLIATSAGEVGVDVSADAMVCDLVAWERMVQRLGRVNRRGGETPTPIVVIPEAAKITEHQARLAAYRAAIDALPYLPDGRRDASVGKITALKDDETAAELLRAASTPEPLRPALTRPLVDAWAMTSLDDHPGRPDDLTPWLRGWVEDDKPQCELVWRQWLPWRAKDEKPDPDEVIEFFRNAPVHLTEILETPIGKAKYGIEKWLSDRVKHFDEEPEDKGPWRERCALLFDRRGKLVGSARQDELRDPDRRKAFAGGIKAGYRLILQVDIGGLSPDGLMAADTTDGAVTADNDNRDDMAWAKQVGWRIVPDRHTVEEDWASVLLLPAVRGEAEDPPPGLRIEKFFGQTDTDVNGKNAPEVARHSQELDEHLNWTEREAETLVGRLGLNDAMKDILCTAAWLHDVGKHRDNWQAFIRNDRGGAPLAKNTKRADPNLLRIGGETYRHEFGSILDAQHGAGPGRKRALAEEAQRRLAKLPDALRDLVLHLVASHHGRARPVIAAVDQDHDLAICEAEARAAALRFARLQKQWGPWGLAWLEAVFRAADAAASAKLDRGVPDDG